MTAFATRTQRALVRVLRRVAIETGPLHRGLVNVVGVARVAVDIPMGTAQGKVSVPVMVEPNLAPRLVDVAIPAFRAKPVVVNVLDAVASDAARRQVLIDFARVARGAGDLFMGVGQREIGL